MTLIFTCPRRLSPFGSLVYKEYVKPAVVAVVNPLFDTILEWIVKEEIKQAKAYARQPQPEKLCRKKPQSGWGESILVSKV
jgi:hypothetical protein